MWGPAPERGLRHEADVQQLFSPWLDPLSLYLLPVLDVIEICRLQSGHSGREGKRIVSSPFGEIARIPSLTEADPGHSLYPDTFVPQLVLMR